MKTSAIAIMILLLFTSFAEARRGKTPGSGGSCKSDPNQPKCVSTTR